mmetsp:Transcript_52213/g.113154  ORF Transcript_52213/g.113154 Transcript_52213/m.113154 type:complete len:94 (+) Transcript_52213:76-357(+)
MAPAARVPMKPEVAYSGHQVQFAEFSSKGKEGPRPLRRRMAMGEPSAAASLGQSAAVHRGISPPLWKPNGMELGDLSRSHLKAAWGSDALRGQ